MVIITPAYGRDYKSKAAFLADFNQDKDFMNQDMFGSQLINREDMKNAGIKEAQIRYSQLRKVGMIKAGKDGIWK